MANNDRRDCPDWSPPVSVRPPSYDNRLSHTPSSLTNRPHPRPEQPKINSPQSHLRHRSTSSRPKVLAPGSVAPEFAHLIHNDRSPTTPVRASAHEHSSISTDQDNRLYSNYHRSTVFVRSPQSTELNGHAHAQNEMRNRTPYPSKDRLMKPVIRTRSLHEGKYSQSMHSSNGDAEESVDGIAEALANVQLDSKPKLVSINRTSKTPRDRRDAPQRIPSPPFTNSRVYDKDGNSVSFLDVSKSSTPDCSEKLPRHSTPIVPGAWPVTPSPPPPPPPPSPPKAIPNSINTPSPSAGYVHESPRLNFAINDKMTGCLRGLSIAHLIHGYEQQVTESHERSRNSSPLTGLKKGIFSPTSNGKNNRSSVDTEFAEDYYLNPLETLQNGGDRTRITESCQTQSQPHDREHSQWIRDINSSSNTSTLQLRQSPTATNNYIRESADSVQPPTREEGMKASWPEFQRTSPQAKLSKFPQTSSSILATQDVSTSGATNNTLCSASPSTAQFSNPNFESEHLPPRGSISRLLLSPIEPPQATPRLSPSLQESLPVTQAPPVPAPSVPANPLLYSHSNYSESYTCSPRASISMSGTPNPPSPGVGVFNSSEAILRTATGRMYFMPDRRNPVDLTPFLKQSHSSEETPSGRVNRLNNAQLEKDRQLLPKIKKEEGSIREVKNPYQLTEAQEELRRDLIERHFRRNLPQSPYTHPPSTTQIHNRNSTTTPNHRTPQPPARTLPRSQFYANLSLQTLNPRVRNTSSIPSSGLSQPSSASIDTQFGYSLHHFSGPYDPHNPHNLLRSHTGSSTSSEWIDVDATTQSNSSPPSIESTPSPAVVVVEEVHAEEEPHQPEMQERRHPSSNTLRQHLLRLYYNLLTLPSSLRKILRKHNPSKDTKHFRLRLPLRRKNNNNNASLSPYPKSVPNTAPRSPKSHATPRLLPPLALHTDGLQDGAFYSAGI